MFSLKEFINTSTIVLGMLLSVGARASCDAYVPPVCSALPAAWQALLAEGIASGPSGSGSCSYDNSSTASSRTCRYINGGTKTTQILSQTPTSLSATMTIVNEPNFSYSCPDGPEGDKLYDYRRLVYLENGTKTETATLDSAGRLSSVHAIWSITHKYSNGATYSMQTDFSMDSKGLPVSGYWSINGSSVDIATLTNCGFFDDLDASSARVLPTTISVTAPTSLSSGTQTALSANVTYNTGVNQTVTPTWSSSDPSAASISSAGVLTAAKLATNSSVTITASYTEHDKTVTTSQVITIIGIPDTVPDAFTFSDTADAAPGASVTSNAIRVMGINIATPISISGGQYSINGGPFTSDRGSVTLGSQVRVRLTTPTGYSQTGTSVLTIGGVSGEFSVTTLSFTPINAPSEVFSNPQTATVQNGMVRFTAAPSVPLQLSANAPYNAAVAFDTDAAIPVASDAATLNYNRRAIDTTFLIRTIKGKPALIPVIGSVNISAPSSGSSIPVTGDDGGSAYIATSAVNTTVAAGKDSDGNVVVAVSSGGKVTYNGSSGGRALPTSFDLYPGETVISDGSGAAGQVRLGSFSQDGSQAGDYIAAIPRVATTLKVPKITTTSSQRFGSAWTTLVGQAIASKLSLGTVTSLSQDSATGVLTLVTNQGTYRFLPIGNLALADAALGNSGRAVSVAAIAANLTAILDSSLSFAVAPATAYADLETALKNLSSSASLEILGDGVILAKLDGTDYIAQPASQTTLGSRSNCPGFVTENNQLALCDATGKRQVLNAAFADADTVRDTFRSALALPTLSVSNTGANGIYSAIVGGTPYSLSPEITLTTPPSSQAGNLWWSDTTSEKFFIRYPSGQAQGFGLR